MKIDAGTKNLIRHALKEDIGSGDVTTRALVPRHAKARAVIIARQAGSIAGLDVAKAVFLHLDKNIRFRPLVRDGDRVPSGKKIAGITGSARAILIAERTALNFLGHLSGIATLTRRFVDKAEPYEAKILDTRKTTPGLRGLEKYAVKCGRGENHRMGLSDGVLIKDNHIAVSSHQSPVASKRKKTLEEMIKDVRKKLPKKIPVEIEVRNLTELKDALQGKPDVVLLDNMSVSAIKKAVKICRAERPSAPALEVSGGVSLGNIRRIAATGVERISVGALTHSAPSLDISLEIT